MTDKTTRLARSLADRAERWADLAADRHNTAYDAGTLATRDAWIGAIAISAAYSVASAARMFTQEEEP